MCGVVITNTTEHARYRYRKTGRLFCSKHCGLKYRDINRKVKEPVVQISECHICEKQITLQGYQLTQWKKTGRAYCSKDCSNIYRSKISSETMTRTNLKYASERMKANNPMRLLETRKKVSDTLKLIKHKPVIQGGNGKPMPKSEQVLHLLLDGLGFVPQYAIKTGLWRKSEHKYPTCYKVDFGNPVLKLSIEADGQSHCSRRHLDAKKDHFLNGLGWQVLRFSNQMILESPDKVIMTVMSTISKLKESTLISPMKS